MSATANNVKIEQSGFGGYQTLSKAEIKKKKDNLYRQSFRDLDDGTIYRDPMGVRAGKEVTLQKDFWEANNKPLAELGGQSVLDFWDDKQRKGFSVTDTVREIRKNLDTGDWTLPLDIIPEVFVVNPQNTPLADLMARETTQDDEVVPTPLTSHPDISWGLETTDDTEGSYSYADAGYGDLSYSVLGYGAAARLEDKMILASSNLRSSESTTQQAFMRGMRIEEENQIINGTGNDSAGYDGLQDIGTVMDDLGDPSSASASDYESATRSLIDEADYQGANRGSLAVVCDFDWHREVRDSLGDRIRYVDPIENLDAGFSTFTLDDVPVFKTHALTRIGDLGATTTSNQAYAVNLEATYLSMLQESSVKPLAKVAPQEQFAVDAYGTLTAEAPDHIQAFSVTTS